MSDEMLTVHCTCGEDFEIFRFQLDIPFSQWDFGEHTTHAMPKDFIQQLRDQVDG